MREGKPPGFVRRFGGDWPQFNFQYDARRRRETGGIGMLVGIALAYGAGRLLQSLLADTKPSDLSTFATSDLLTVSRPASNWRIGRCGTDAVADASIALKE